MAHPPPQAKDGATPKAPKIRERQKSRTREKIAKAAFELFSSRGITFTTTLHIARRAGVSHGSVFAHFPTKQDLVVSVIQKYAARMVERIHELAEAGAGLRPVLQAHLAGLSQYEPFYANLITEGPILPADVRLTLLAIQSAVSFHLAEAAEAEARQARLKPVRLDLLFNTWIGLLHHFLANRDLFAPGKSVLAARGEELIDHFLGLLRPG